MSAYERFADGLNFNSSNLSKDECNYKKKEFYKCVVEKKNELTKTTSNWKNYRSDVRGISQECYDSNSLSSCANYYSLLELNY